MVLRCDKYPPGLDFLYRMITAPMTVRHLRRRTAEGQPEQLVAEADPECRDALRRQLANDSRCVSDSVRIARSVGEKNSVGFVFECGLGRGVCRHHRHATIIVREQPQNVALDSVIVGDDVMSRARIAPGIRVRCRHPGGQIETLHRWTRIERGATHFIRLIAASDDSAHHSHRPQMPAEAPSVNILNDWYLGCGMPGSKSAGSARGGLRRGQL